ncbi:MAG: hypothetical protein FJ022_07130 [Chloroflexi bacterium]|nr:hypothetical protein [Chloroflexota bacterium]MBM4450550.1 hypothetical protein [Chloroflexota bacterium]
MVKHPEVRILVKHGLLSEIEGLFLSQRMRRESDSLASALAMAGFKDASPFLEALGQEKSQETAARRGFLVNPLVADMTFNTFVQANSYLAAVELVLRVCRDSPFKSNLSFIYGRAGLGKTHLLNATYHDMTRFHPERNTVFVNMLDLAVALMRANKRGVRSEFIDFLSRIDTLLVDDVQFCEASSQVQADLLEVIERQLEQAQHRLIFSCDVRPVELQLTVDRLKSAMEKMATAELKPPDKVEREQMVLRFAGGAGLPAEIRSYIAENITENIRELKAAAIQLVAVARGLGKETYLELAKEVVSLISGSTQQKPGISGSEPGVMADETDPGANHHSQLLKQIVHAAESSAEHALANQIVLSQTIERLSRDKSAANRPLVAGLQIALHAIREGDLTTASKLMRGCEMNTKQRPAPSIAVAESEGDSKLPLHRTG